MSQSLSQWKTMMRGDDIHDIMAELRSIAKENRENKEWGGFGLSDKLEFLVESIQRFLERQDTID